MNQDQTILELIQKVKEQKELISKTERSSWATSCQFGSTNIHTADRDKIVEIAARICGERRNMKEAAKLLDAKFEPTFFGFSFEDCISDLKTRLSKIKLVAEKKKLADLETRLNGLMSSDLKTKLEIEKIQKELEK